MRRQHRWWFTGLMALALALPLGVAASAPAFTSTPTPIAAAVGANTPRPGAAPAAQIVKPSGVYLPLILSGWRPVAPTLTPTVAATPTQTPTAQDLAPNAGSWSGASGAITFAVTDDRASVDDFAVTVNVASCGSYQITHTPLLAITNGSFAFTGSFYGSGVFSSATQCSGMAGLVGYDIPGCGVVSGGPWNYTATWQGSGWAVTLGEPAEAVVVQPLGSGGGISSFQAQSE